MTSMTMTTPQINALGALLAEGFSITNTYEDGIVRVARALPNGDSLVTFVRPDGTHRPPRSWTMMVFSC